MNSDLWTSRPKLCQLIVVSTFPQNLQKRARRASEILYDLVGEGRGTGGGGGTTEHTHNAHGCDDCNVHRHHHLQSHIIFLYLFLWLCVCCASRLVASERAAQGTSSRGRGKSYWDIRVGLEWKVTARRLVSVSAFIGHQSPDSHALG